MIDFILFLGIIIIILLIIIIKKKCKIKEGLFLFEPITYQNIGSNIFSIYREGCNVLLPQGCPKNPSDYYVANEWSYDSYEGDKQVPGDLERHKNKHTNQISDMKDCREVFLNSSKCDNKVRIEMARRDYK